MASPRSRSVRREIRRFLLQLAVIAIFGLVMWLVVRPIATDYLVHGFQQNMAPAASGR